MSAAPGIYLVVRDPALITQARGLRPYTDVAVRAQCAPATICLLATGARRRVTAELAGRIEDALDQPRGTLFALTPADQATLEPYSDRVA